MMMNKNPDAVLAERRRIGREMRLKMHGEDFVNRAEAATDDFLKLYYDTTEEFCWGSIWSREALDTKIRSAMALAVTAAQNQSGAVKQHVNTALRSGWSREEIGEILLHVYVYAGCYPSLAAFHAAKEVFDTIDEADPGWKKKPFRPKTKGKYQGRSYPPTGDWSSLAERGLQLRRDVLGGADVDRWMGDTVDDEFIMMFFNTTHEFCFGTIWARPGLEPRIRSILSLTMVSARGQQEAVQRHVRSCVEAGLSMEEIGEIFLHVCVYAGVYSCLQAFLTAQEVFKQLRAEGITVKARKDAPTVKAKEAVKLKEAKKARKATGKEPSK